jgi:hypothetical protein
MVSNNPSEVTCEHPSIYGSGLRVAGFGLREDEDPRIYG